MQYSSIQDAWLSAHNYDNYVATITPCTWKDALDWIEQIDHFPKVVWHSREDDSVYFAVGITSDVTQSIQFKIQSFDPNEPQWTGFPSTLTIRPQHILRWTIDTCTLHSVSSSETLEIEKGLDPQDSPELPGKFQWTQNIEHCKILFEDTKLEKIVLARQSTFKLKSPWRKFQEMYESQRHCYHFLIQPTSDRCFFGASPEKLFSLDHDTLETEALAGTAAITGNQALDDEQTNYLVHSTKDQKEHEIVVHYIESQLHNLSSSQTRHAQDLVTLPHVQHLRTRLSYQLLSNIRLDEILDKLHPTPAVCGLPQQNARINISKLEPFHRGWYAGTMGIVTDDYANFTVLIRSALWINGEGYTWSGAGIVHASDPDAEWTEINNKAKQFLG